MEQRVIKAKLKKWLYAVPELMAQSLGLWFTVFATVVLCVLMGMRIHSFYVDYIYVDGYEPSQARELVIMRILVALQKLIPYLVILVVTVFPIVLLFSRRKQKGECKSKSQIISSKKFGEANIQIRKKEFRNLFSADFNGKGKGGAKIDYCDRLMYILEDKNETYSTTELMRLALALWESKGVLKEKSAFSDWARKFCNALSVEPPCEMSPNKYKTDRNIAEEYNFLNFSKKS